MRARLTSLLSGIALGLVLSAFPVAAAGVLQVGGTGAAAALLAHVGKPFTQQTGIAVEVKPGLGSSGGLSALAAGVLDVAVAGRALSGAEAARGLVPVITIRTPFVFVTSHHAPPSMTVPEIANVYTAEKVAWPDGSPVVLILRPREDADNHCIVQYFLGKGDVLGRARQRAELPVAVTDQDNAGMAERLKGSLAAATYAQIILEQRDLRMIAVDGVVPSIETLASGAYLPTKVLYFVHPLQPSAAASRFIQFLRSDEGVRALREAHTLPGVE